MKNKAIRVLVIEDNPGDARLIQEMLSEGGDGRFEVEVVGRLSAGLEHLEQEDVDVVLVDVVLLDLGLPDSQGIYTLLRVHEHVPSLPIVVLTGLSDEELALRAVQLGAQDYLVKGRVDSNLLTHSIYYAFERKRMEQELREKKGQLETQNEELRAVNDELQATEAELRASNDELQATNEELRCEIIERRQVEAQLQQSEEKYSTLVEQGNDGIIIIQDGILRFANSKMVELTGFSLETTLGRSFVDFVSLGNRELVAERYKRRMSGEDIPNKYEIEILSEGGGKIPVEISASSIEYEGRPADMAIVRDVTERKRAEESIKRAVEEWRTTFDAITDLVSIHDKDFRLVRVNKAFADVFKMKPAELIGKICHEIVHGTNEPVLNCPHKKALATEEPAREEFFEPSLGIHLEVATSPIFDEKGEVVASVHVARDVTERRNMERQLIITDRLASVGELASGIAHELNNPLTSVIGFSQLLLDKDVTDDIKEDVKIISSEAQRAAGVVKNLLTFARKHGPAKQLVSINEVIEKVLELRAYEQRVNNIRVKRRLAVNLPEVMADYFQLQQVFLNIIINAEHFMIEAHNRGTLTITTGRV
jgi:PAS domain S-box-containing protein